MRSYRRALLTGATSGIGAAFAAELPRTTDLLLCGRDEDKLAEARQHLAGKGRVVETMVADFGDEAAVRALIGRADQFGIDLLINNAGTGRLGRVIDNAIEAERETAMVNVVAVVMLTRGLLPGMIDRARKIRRRAGVIVVSSTTKDDAGEPGAQGTAAPAEATPSPKAGKKKRPRKSYTIKAGDTRSGIPVKVDVPLDQILELNPDLDPRKLRIGQAIKLPIK